MRGGREGAGGCLGGQGKYWIKNNAFSFQNKLKEKMEDFHMGQLTFENVPGKLTWLSQALAH